ncbi:retron St85 family RNA-directed DNA polymerase [Reichenbachiella ulvae]|uniref:RNA-directed DNA polymerase n=1 Tax=Reichenbachiella ulvae TaxID=2980104 RepID=A0ABT3CSE9_9BACT|nr:retron St85 family RNA-directed DNA polymerase [Reichenbachiella ulvae]MCV9386434.1 retron St85 family RNA-directed DNA polymerase [Reichenbachiella ulvae]
MAKTEKIKLSMLGLPVIQNLDDFSNLTHISKYTIYQLSYHSSYYYRTYTISKKSGKKRVISQPSKKMKGLQSWVLVNILNKLQVSGSCKGFRKGSSILDNALPHQGANTILNIDLKDFFPSISSKRVFNLYKSLGYNNLISTVLTNICTYENTLPQGGPCSPMLSNLVTWTLDLRIQGYVGKRGVNYTRYADDLSFSGLHPSKVLHIIPMINKIINDENFDLNYSKTRVASSARAKIVTGLVINEDSVGIGKKRYKLLRSKIHHLTLSSEQKNTSLLNHVKGWISYLYSVDKKRYKKVQNYITELSNKHPKTLVSQLLVPAK